MAGIHEADLFGDLTEHELEKVRTITDHRHFKADDLIVAVGEKVANLYIVADGAVRVVVPVEDPKGSDEQVLATLGVGDCFGEFSFIDRETASASVYAKEDTRVMVLNYTDLDDLLEGLPMVPPKPETRELLAKVLSDLGLLPAGVQLAQGDEHLLVAGLEQQDHLHCDEAKERIAAANAVPGEGFVDVERLIPLAQVEQTVGGPEPRLEVVRARVRDPREASDGFLPLASLEREVRIVEQVDCALRHGETPPNAAEPSSPPVPLGDPAA